MRGPCRVFIGCRLSKKTRDVVFVLLFLLFCCWTTGGCEDKMGKSLKWFYPLARFSPGRRCRMRDIRKRLNIPVRTLWAAAFIGLAGVAVYAPSFNSPFLFDDNGYILA